jgi:predicted anti-sigma-YlaC factor YlaD
MLQCDAAQRLIARAAGNDAGSPELDAHLAECAPCRQAFAEQQQVALMLAGRAPAPVPPGFAARLSARLDAESRPGVLDLADWRAWTAGLAPLAAALVVAAYLGVGAGTPRTAAIDEPAATASAEPTFDTWTASAATDTPASVFLQPAASTDLLIETVLTGAVPAWSTANPGDDNVR